MDAEPKNLYAPENRVTSARRIQMGRVGLGLPDRSPVNERRTFQYYRNVHCDRNFVFSKNQTELGPKKKEKKPSRYRSQIRVKRFSEFTVRDESLINQFSKPRVIVEFPNGVRTR